MTEVPMSESFSFEPPFAGMLRALTSRGVIVHLDDSSRILGRVDHVSEDGMLVDLDNGPSFYTVDVSKIAVVETGGGVPRSLAPADRAGQESGR